MNFILTNQPGNLDEIRNQIAKIAFELFQKIISTPIEQRGEDKERTGISVIAEVRYSNNFTSFDCLFPSQRAKRFVHRKVDIIQYGDVFTSRERENEELGIFPGGISSYYGKGKNNPNGLSLIVGVSGLRSEEDEVIATILASKILGIKADFLAENLKEQISPEIFNGYLWELIQQHS